MSFNKKEWGKQYKHTPKGKKSRTIARWKYRGLIGDYESIYDRYINTTHCDLCNIELCKGFKGGNKKCMDHDHNTGLFRNIVCNTCNSNKSDFKKPTTNKSGYKNISYSNTYKCWVYEKKIKSVKIKKMRKNKIDILCFKFAGILLYKY